MDEEKMWKDFYYKIVEQQEKKQLDEQNDGHEAR